MLGRLRFLHTLATASRSDEALIIEFQQLEKQLQRKRIPGPIQTTPAERERLLELGQRLGKSVDAIITIVTPDTFHRWERAAKAPPDSAQPQRRPGRPPTAAATVETVLELARKNAWGYKRIFGELKKLRLKLARSSIANILKAHGYDPGPKRGPGTWNEFVRRHAETLWACDFFTKDIWTLAGMQTIFVFFVIHIGSRRVHIAGFTPNPTRPWVAQQARNVSMFLADQGARPTHLLRDHDGKFGRDFDAVFAAEGIEVKPVGPHAPDLNAHAERFVGSIKRECLDHFMVFGEAHLRHILSEYETYYNTERPHQGVGNVPLTAQPAVPADGPIACRERLGGLLQHYYRKAA